MNARRIGRNCGENGTDVGNVVEQKEEKAPKNWKIHAENEQPGSCDDRSDQIDESLDDHVSLDVIQKTL